MAPRGNARRRCGFLIFPTSADMSSSVHTAHAMAPETPTAKKATPLAAWLREPLLHFALLGAVLFGIDHLFAIRADDPNVIVISAEVSDQARQLFKGSRGREPHAEELA